MKIYCVYMHVTPCGKRYIGVTKRNPIYRWDNGNGYKHNSYFYRAILKYGWDNISHEIVATSLSVDEAEQMERDLISRYSATDQNHGYNIESGGISCKEMSLETRHKLSLAKAGIKHGPMPKETRNKLSKVRKAQGNFRQGTHHTDEAKRKIGEGNKGKTVVVKNETKEKIAASLTGIKRSEITRNRMSLAKKGKSHPQTAKWISVEQIDSFGKTVNIYESMLQASKATNTRYTGISRCCRGDIKTSNGYIWRYATKIA